MFDSKKDDPVVPRKRVEGQTTVTIPPNKSIIKQGVFESPLGEDSDDLERWAFIQGTMVEQDEVGFFDQDGLGMHGKIEIIDKVNGNWKQLIGFIVVHDDLKVLHGPNCRSMAISKDGQVCEEIGKFDKGNLIQGTSLKQSPNCHEYRKIDHVKKKEYKILKLDVRVFYS